MPRGAHGKSTEKVKTTTRQTKKPSVTGRALAVTKGKGKKKGLKRQGY